MLKLRHFADMSVLWLIYNGNYNHILGGGGWVGMQHGEKEVSKNKICEAQVKFTVSYKKSIVEN